MPKITTQVARQRYERVPVIDPETGQQKKAQVNQRRRRGDRPVFRPVFENDRTKPLPPRKCEKCGAELTVGQAYRSIGIKRQFGGIIRYRCMNCPVWQPWEYSDSLSARVMQIQNEGVDGSGWEAAEDAEARASELAEMIRELVSEKQDSLDNMPEGLRDASELSEQVDSLDSWADEVEQAGTEADFPEGKCGNCGGEQMECSVHEEEKHSDDPDDPAYCDGTEECMECNGSGDGEDIDDQELDEWREEAATAIQNALDNSPV